MESMTLMELLAGTDGLRPAILAEGASPVSANLQECNAVLYSNLTRNGF